MPYQYEFLDRITVKELLHLCEQNGFLVENLHLGRSLWFRPSKALLNKFDKQELLTKEMWLVLRKPHRIEGSRNKVSLTFGFT